MCSLELVHITSFNLNSSSCFLYVLQDNCIMIIAPTFVSESSVLCRKGLVNLINENARLCYTKIIGKVQRQQKYCRFQSSTLEGIV